MAHFPLTGKLLSETTFFTFISRVNEDYTSLDSDEYEQHIASGKPFTLNLKTWLSKCKDVKTMRLENDAPLTFCTFALNRLKALINFDIDLYVKEFRSGKKGNSQEFIEELENIKAYIKEAPYLAPIAAELLDTLSSVPGEILRQDKPANTAPETEGQDYLVWNGPVAELFKLFEELRTTKSSISARSLLDYAPSDLGAFIIKHFRDSNGEVIPESNIAAHMKLTEADPPKGRKVKSGK